MKQKKQKKTAEDLFVNKTNATDMPTEQIEIKQQITVLDFISKLSIVKSKSEARRLIEQGGITIDSDKKNDINEILNLTKNEFIVQKGKKTFIKVKII